MNQRPWMVTAALGTVCFSFSSGAFAKPLQIIHTNDLHSHFERGDDVDRGGYAAVKGVMDRIKSSAAAQGIESLVLDGGDFSEGSPFFIAKQGEDSWRMIQSMGYDAITMGNHDWFVGPAQMEKIVANIHPTVPFLSANLQVKSYYPNLRQAIQPHVELTRAGMKIAVVGLSTDEIHYKWLYNDGKISSPKSVLKKELKELRSRNDLVIALTHIGLDADKKLAKEINGVDLIVGAHSHTTLKEPVLVKSPNGREVPIVQTGAHGQYVGDLLIDYEPGQPIRVIHDRLVPVVRDFEVDESIRHQVAEAREDLEHVYTPEWLYQKVTESAVPMEAPLSRPTTWGNFYTDAIREAVGADMALDESQFYGMGRPAGSFNREDILNFYPHFFNLEHPMGWTVWTIRAPGWEIALILGLVVKSGSFFNLSQCDYDVTVKNGKPSMHNLRINGRKVNYFKNYTIAVSEGIGLGAKKMIGGLTRIFTRPWDSSIPVWTAVENKIARTSSEEFQNLKSASPHKLPADINWIPASFEHLGTRSDTSELLDR